MDLLAEVESVKGVGPKSAETLNRAGIFTVRDLLYFLPRAYENYQATVPISELKPGKVMIKGRIRGLRVVFTRRKNFTITQGEVYDETGSVRVVWYNQPYRAKAFDEKKEYFFTGNYDFKYNRYQLSNPMSVLASEVDAHEAFQPIYSAKGGLKPAFYKKIIRGLRSELALVPDLLPENEPKPDFLRPGTRAEALYAVHFPVNQGEVNRGREYLAYEELFELLLAAKLNKQENQKLRARGLPFVAKNTRALVGSLPFQLTDAQRRATWDILQDMEKETPMNRLLQGDVGAGKTVVAAIAAYQAICAEGQVALLAPTAILATQHAEGLEKILRPLGVKVALLTGATKRKGELKKRILAGEVDLVVGTHALLTDDTIFKTLALCIIDEQHRFGVQQRQRLLVKSERTAPGLAPHFLAMTATPIPRSLQLTIFGDLDVSVINQLPKGRQPIKTAILNEHNMKDELYPELRERLKNHEQVYWICRAIDSDGVSSDRSSRLSSQGSSLQARRNCARSSETHAVIDQAKLVKKLFPTMRVEYLHGKMKQEEKDRIMWEFAAGKIDILVSTTVVEVGVDVPNATQIVVMDAEGYGLAQLHQLRGRVGRGDKPSNCHLVVTGEEPPSQRLRELEKSTDGFHLAEVDLKIRGPGEIYGNLQHGALDLRIATLSDTALISAAQKQAQAFAKNPENMVEYRELAQIITKYQQLATLN